MKFDCDEVVVSAAMIGGGIVLLSSPLWLLGRGHFFLAILALFVTTAIFTWYSTGGAVGSG